MKTLWLLRHAKSGHDEYVLSDVERHLSPRGYRDAEEQAVLFAQHYTKPDCIMSSPGIRAFTTALIFARQLQYPLADIKMNAQIYEASTRILLSVITELDKNFNSVMLVGHNPGFTDIVNALCGNVISDLPTSGCAGVQLKVDTWQEVSYESGVLVK